MTNHETTIQKIEQKQTELVRLYHSVPVTALLEPDLPSGESVKDLLGHLAAWQWRCAELLDQAHADNSPFDTPFDAMAFNRETFYERQEWSWAEIEQDYRAAYQAVIDAIRALPAERLTDGAVQAEIGRATWERMGDYLLDLRRWHQRVSQRRRRR